MTARTILSSINTLVSVLVVVFSLSNQGEAQALASITINAPANETSVQPGQTLTVAASASGVSQLAIAGNGPIGATQLQSGGGNVTFSVAIPASIKPGRYFLTGVGTDSSGALVRSDSVSIVVPNVAVSALSISPKSLFMAAPGHQSSIEVFGLANGGKTAMSNEGLNFSSSDPLIASVDSQGTVIGQSAGTAQINVTSMSGVNTLSASIKVTVGGAVRGDLNNDGRVDISDVNALDAVLNTPANGPNDARDLNHDGKIDALDARIMVGLCTYPRCATHP